MFLSGFGLFVDGGQGRSCCLGHFAPHSFFPAASFPVWMDDNWLLPAACHSLPVPARRVKQSVSSCPAYLVSPLQISTTNTPSRPLVLLPFLLFFINHHLPLTTQSNYTSTFQPTTNQPTLPSSCLTSAARISPTRLVTRSPPTPRSPPLTRSVTTSPPLPTRSLRTYSSASPPLHNETNSQTAISPPTLRSPPPRRLPTSSRVPRTRRLTAPRALECTFQTMIRC